MIMGKIQFVVLGTTQGIYTYILDVRAIELQQDLETDVYIYEDVHQVFLQICFLLFR